MRDSFKTRQSLAVGSQSYEIYSLPALEGRDLGRLPFSLKILLENLLRFEDGVNVTREDVEACSPGTPRRPRATRSRLRRPA
jgi:aconitate hydratase